jgi:hypothetical protein
MSEPIQRIIDLPRQRCAGRFCPTEGPFTDQRIIWVGAPHSDIVGWCDTCRRRVCSHCALWEDVDREAFWAMPSDDSLKSLCLRLGKFPASSKCRHCGEFLGIAEGVLILVNEGDDAI